MTLHLRLEGLLDLCFVADIGRWLLLQGQWTFFTWNFNDLYNRV